MLFLEKRDHSTCLFLNSRIERHDALVKWHVCFFAFAYSQNTRHQRVFYKVGSFCEVVFVLTFLR